MAEKRAKAAATSIVMWGVLEALFLLIVVFGKVCTGAVTPGGGWLWWWLVGVGGGGVVVVQWCCGVPSGVHCNGIEGCA